MLPDYEESLPQKPLESPINSNRATKKYPEVSPTSKIDTLLSEVKNYKNHMKFSDSFQNSRIRETKYEKTQLSSIFSF